MVKTHTCHLPLCFFSLEVTKKGKLFCDSLLESLLFDADAEESRWVGGPSDHVSAEIAGLEGDVFGSGDEGGEDRDEKDF